MASLTLITVDTTSITQLPQLDMDKTQRRVNGTLSSETLGEKTGVRTVISESQLRLNMTNTTTATACVDC